ncbi:hypothetical protein F2Q69_00020178 [Brassica cretica]|uniref:Uncharacterized protein n=1 Tax=Brassica cretica TaxID=69181 RepID=A0A8S9QMC6_BRACR|nr:hypothetical protein F2Q69_00020178 [Brassica cretica]
MTSLHQVAPHIERVSHPLRDVAPHLESCRRHVELGAGALPRCERSLWYRADVIPRSSGSLYTSLIQSGCMTSLQNEKQSMRLDSELSQIGSSDNILKPEQTGDELSSRIQTNINARWR